MSAPKVVVGMSGGVDSSVAAWLLKEAGYEVIGVTMEIWQPEDVFTQSQEGGCCGLSAVKDAERVAEVIGIPYYVMNFREVFQKKVIDYFVREYREGRTPNPCIACNRYVKWEALLHRSLEIGADYIATGHYAKMRRGENGRFTLEQTPTKDQTYALYGLTQEQLSRTLFPVGEYSKDEIRKIAEDAHLPVAHKPDSQEICFVPDGDYASFIEKETREKLPEGNFVDLHGKILGRHKGIIHYTVGQRKGLGLSLTEPGYVLEIRPKTNEVVVGNGEEILATSLRAHAMNWMSIDACKEPRNVTAKIRYNHPGITGRVTPLSKDQVRVDFDRPQRAVTPGQAVVLYEDGCVLGGGIIIE